VCFEFQSVADELILLDYIVSLIRHADSSDWALCHYLKGSEHILPEYVVTHEVLTDQSTQNLASMYAYLKIDILEILTLFTHFCDSFNHAVCHQDGRVYFIDQVVGATLNYGNLAIIAHDQVHVPV
jgi:hypothetical protein